MVREILLELRAMHADLQELREAQEDIARHMLEPDDRRIGAVLLPLLSRIFGSQQFAAAQVVAKALDHDLDSQVLRQLIGDRLEEPGPVHVIGRLLARLEGKRFKGYRLVEFGSTRGVRLMRVLPPSKPASVDLLRGDVNNGCMPPLNSKNGNPR